MSVGRTKSQVFSYIKDRVARKLRGWKEKLLNQSGKEVLLKSVIQVIPSYSMSCFRLPKELQGDQQGNGQLLMGTRSGQKKDTLQEMD